MSQGLTNENSETIEIKKSGLEDLMERKVQEKIEEMKFNKKTRNQRSKGLNRREFLRKAGLGLGGLAALTLPTNALEIRDESFGVLTGDSSSQTEYFSVGQNGPVSVVNTDLDIGDPDNTSGMLNLDGDIDLNNNSINGVSSIDLNLEDLGTSGSSGEVATAQGDGTVQMEEVEGMEQHGSEFHNQDNLHNDSVEIPTYPSQGDVPDIPEGAMVYIEDENQVYFEDGT